MVIPPPTSEAPRESKVRLRTFGAIGELAKAMTADLGRVGRRLVPTWRTAAAVVKGGFLGLAIVLPVLATSALWALYPLPIEKLSSGSPPALLLEASNGEPLGRIGMLGQAAKREDFPESLVKAVLSIEDRRFYEHWGVDPWAIGRATYANWAAGDVVEGGSTITQQLVKMQIVGKERSLNRKAREAAMALWLELRLDKNEILTRYLNSVYLGQGIYGMSAAARAYFDKKLQDLTLPEVALLAGLIQAPSRYDPVYNLDAAHRRAAVVLDAMVETGAIEAKDAEKAKANAARLRASPNVARAASFFTDWIAKRELPKITATDSRPLRVRTTFEPRLQKLAERVVEDVLRREGANRNVGQAALVAMRPDGAVVAMVGGRNYGESQFNRAVEAQRQPGSAFKLFVYYAALRNGYSPWDTVDASPVEIGKWRPENYGGQQYGDMTLMQAFAQSVNSAAVRLAMTVGLDQVVDAARELGITRELTKVPSMALGTNELSLLELTAAFGSVRAGKPKLVPWGIAAFGVDGAPLRPLGAPAAPQQSLPYRDELVSLLRAVVERGTGRRAALDAGDAAGKTGTSQDHRDAWFVGFNDSLIVGVWVGNDDREPMADITGGSLPAQIWKRFVSEATQVMQRPAKPEMTVEASSMQVAAETSSCNVEACAAAYNSFRASDCTYQPYSGPRRLCQKGERQTREAEARWLSGRRTAQRFRASESEFPQRRYRILRDNGFWDPFGE